MDSLLSSPSGSSLAPDDVSIVAGDHFEPRIWVTPGHGPEVGGEPVEPEPPAQHRAHATMDLFPPPARRAAQTSPDPRSWG